MPLSANQDFFAILEREMAKEASKGGAKSKPAAKKANFEEIQ